VKFVDQQSGLAVGHRVGSAAGSAADDRDFTRIRLKKDNAESSTSRTVSVIRLGITKTSDRL